MGTDPLRRPGLSSDGGEHVGSERLGGWNKGGPRPEAERTMCIEAAPSHLRWQEPGSPEEVERGPWDTNAKRWGTRLALDEPRGQAGSRPRVQ